MEAEAPEWLFPLLEAEFRTARTTDRDRNNYSFYCMTCKGNSFREIDKPNHPNHEILQVVKASYHFAVKVVDMERRLSCDRIAQFSFNNNGIFFIKSRVKPEEENGRPNKRAKRSEPEKACTVCGWRLPEGDTTSLYCSLACKFKRNDVNPNQDKDLNEEEQAAVVSDNQEIACGRKGMEYTETKMNVSYRKRSRKGIPIRSESHCYTICWC